MVNCYFNGKYYYILGKDLEIFSSIINPETDLLRQAYWTFIMLIPELSPERDNITFFNDTRLIDDMNGLIDPVDEWTREAKRIGRQMLTSLNGIALFRKCDATKLNNVLAIAHSNLSNPATKQMVADSIEESWRENHQKRIRKLREHFFGDNNVRDTR